MNQIFPNTVNLNSFLLPEKNFLVCRFLIHVTDKSSDYKVVLNKKHYTVYSVQHAACLPNKNAGLKNLKLNQTKSIYVWFHAGIPSITAGCKMQNPSMFGFRLVVSNPKCYSWL